MICAIFNLVFTQIFIQLNLATQELVQQVREVAVETFVFLN